MKLRTGVILSGLKASLGKKSPAILTGFGIAGFIASMVLVGKEAPKAKEKIDEKKAELNVEKLSIKDTIVTAGPCFVPAIITAGASAGCVLGGLTISTRRNAALAAAYGLTEAALKEYKEKTMEVVGERKEQVIHDHIAKDKVDKDPISKKEEKEIIYTGHGDHLCYDSISGRYFYSNIDKIKKVENKISKRLISEMYISLNELYGELGLPAIKLGDELGWNINDGIIEMIYSSQLTDRDEPCLVIDYCVCPRYDFTKLS